VILSQAIEFNSQDPLAYYFRALTLWREGHCAEARGDMMTGAMLEAQQSHRYDVGSALVRIQGPARLMLEQIRRDARMSAVQASGAVPAASGPAAAPNASINLPGESDVLRERRVVPLEELLRPGGPHTIPDETPAELPPQTKSPAAPAAPTAPGATGPNPFGDDSADQPAPKAAPSVPPSAAPPAAPPKTPPQENTPKPAQPAKPPAGADENPFG
jgi:hypothetical protein